MKELRCCNDFTPAIFTRNDSAKAVDCSAAITHSRSVAHDSTALVWLSRHPDIQVLRWPQDVAEHAVNADRPCLWLVDEGATPPDALGCVEDWLWVTASDPEMQARLSALASRAAIHPRRPELDSLGQLTYGNRSLFLSPTDDRIMHLLIRHFGDVVGDDELLAEAWPDGASAQVLRVHISRLRRRVRPFGLAITCARGTGYMLDASSDH
jgi:hypothetical protein